MNTYEKPLVLGINQDAPRDGMPLDTRLDRFGQNTGNLLFGEALFQVVGNSQRASYHYGVREIEAADVVVVAAANWINPHSDFGGIAQRLRSHGKPVVLVGIGLQQPSLELTDLKDGTRALLDLAAETSGAISTRGHRTAELLRGWGYANVMATGCPSLLLSDGKFTSHVFTPEPTPENTVLMGTRHLLYRTSPVQDEIYRTAYQSGSDIVMQSELADMYFILGEPRDDDLGAKANATLSASYGEPDIAAIRKYLVEHGHVFFHARDWRSYLQRKEYVVGTRVHGVIATILSGRRGILLNHDPRTAELAEIMGIPSVSLEDVGPISFERIAELIKETDFDQTRRRFAEYHANFARFFAANGLPMRAPNRLFGE